MRKKRQSSQQCHLALLGPMSVKAASRTLVKLTPDVPNVAIADADAAGVIVEVATANAVGLIVVSIVVYVVAAAFVILAL